MDEQRNEEIRPVNPRRRKRSKMQIFKEAYLPVVIAGAALLLIVIFIIGSIFVGGGFMLYSIAGNRLFAYYAIAAVVQVGASIISGIGVPLIINEEIAPVSVKVIVMLLPVTVVSV